MGCNSSTAEGSGTDISLPENYGQHLKACLQMVLSHPVAREKFRKYLETKSADEHSLFWLEVEEFKKASEAELQKKAESIFQRYIVPGAEKEINISFEKKLVTTEELVRVRELSSISSRSRFVTEMIKETFTPAQEAVLELLAFSCFPDFLQSRLGSDLVRSLEDKKDEKKLLVKIKQSRNLNKKKPSEKEWLARFVQVADGLPVCICLSDMLAKDQPVVYVNREFENVTGYSVKDAIDRNCRFLQGKATSPAVRAELKKKISAGERVNICVTNYKKSGEEFINFLSLKPIFDSQKRCRYYLGVQFDVTQAQKNGRLGVDLIYIDSIINMFPEFCF